MAINELKAVVDGDGVEKGTPAHDRLDGFAFTFYILQVCYLTRGRATVAVKILLSFTW
jgi:hypothetical protein